MKEFVARLKATGFFEITNEEFGKLTTSKKKNPEFFIGYRFNLTFKKGFKLRKNPKFYVVRNVTRDLGPNWNTSFEYYFEEFLSSLEKNQGVVDFVLLNLEFFQTIFYVEPGRMEVVPEFILP